MELGIRGRGRREEVEMVLSVSQCLGAVSYSACYAQE